MKQPNKPHDLQFETRAPLAKVVGDTGPVVTKYLLTYRCDTCNRRAKFITEDETSLPKAHELEHAGRRLAAYPCEVSI
jgi:hypothetical protein